MSDIRAMKDTARAKAKESLRLLGSDDLARGSDAIQRRLLDIREYKESSSVFTYLSTDEEISTDLIVTDAVSEGKRLFLPLFADGAYKLIEHIEGDALHVGRFGIREPENKNEVLPESLFSVVPGLAFDRACHRLGRGCGFYDRILSRLLSEGVTMFSAGLTFDATLYDAVPVEASDFDLDLVVTENESVRRSV